MYFLYMFIFGIVFYIIFSILFLGLNRSALKLFIPLQKLVNKSKRKKVYKNVVNIVFIFIYFYIIDSFKLNGILSGILISFFICLQEIIFTENKDL